MTKPSKPSKLDPRLDDLEEPDYTAMLVWLDQLDGLLKDKEFDKVRLNLEAYLQMHRFITPLDFAVKRMLMQAWQQVTYIDDVDAYHRHHPKSLIGQQLHRQKFREAHFAGMTRDQLKQIRKLAQEFVNKL